MEKKNRLLILQRLKWWHFLILSLVFLWLDFGLISHSLFLIVYTFSIWKFFKDHKNNKLNLFLKNLLILISVIIFSIFSIIFYSYYYHPYKNTDIYAQFKKLPKAYKAYGYKKCFSIKVLNNIITGNANDCCLSVIVNMAKKDMIPYDGKTLPDCDSFFCGPISPMCNGSISFVKDPDSLVAINDLDDCLKLKGKKPVLDNFIRSNVPGAEITKDDFNEETEVSDVCILNYIRENDTVIDIKECDKIESVFYRKSCSEIIKSR